ncbi:HupE/UreJ family protein [Hymenobacter sp. DH14]|uniref:HupE/UreJ family protein n=1 Tax=Hymenobacter cyanobacteriorum TaxID=2926463 RepID=A0A9X1VCP2_9BACT|nr:HupE/UreJ family protein [Hymenobacter cyanobacteriorum]MCI1186724.1 HupE/UreJ family protein [Hymenobacter cyanobacteriorum]
MQIAARHSSSWLFRLLGLLLLTLLGLLVAFGAQAHPMPNSVVLLDLHPTGVGAELQLPLGELQAAFGHDVAQHPETLVARLGPELRAYLAQHVRSSSPNGRPWAVAVRDLHVHAAEQTATGPYQELTARLWLTPAEGESPRAFTLNYDVIVHQVVTHMALVSVRRDWEMGRVGPDEAPIEIGVIRLDVVNNVIPPLDIRPAGGGWWAGFKGMVALGLRHIAEGTDHLLFLLLLLLPAPLLLNKARGWGRFGGVRYSLGRLLQVVTAFTLGHSLTLLAGALGWLRLPSQPVEILIAVSILVSAVHALRPLFPGRETWVAAGFGLVHGLAFASTLAELQLPAGPMALSILGFNLGIELMQLFVIALTMPWLLLLSHTRYYPAVRVAGALAAAVAALAWLTERIFNQANPLSALVARVAHFAPWLLAALAAVALLSFWQQRRNQLA